MDCLQFVDTGIIEDIRYMQGAVENARLLEDLQATDCCSEDISDDVLDGKPKADAGIVLSNRGNYT